MPCTSFGVSQVLVGLYRVGVVGLRQAFERADVSGLRDPEQVLGFLIESLAADNYIPESMAGPYRTAIWREYLRRRGEDFSGFYSEVEITVRGDAGEERDRFVVLLTSVLAEMEIRPLVTLAPPGEDGQRPQAEIGDHTVIRAWATREALKTEVRKSISDW